MVRVRDTRRLRFMARRCTASVAARCGARASGKANAAAELEAWHVMSIAWARLVLG